MSPQLSLQFLRSPQIHLDGAPILPERRSVIALLAYLALNPQRHSREFLSSLFWSQYNQTKAFTNLRHTLWEVHKSIGKDWIISDRTTVNLNQEADISLDVAQFQDSLHEACRQNDLTLRTSLLVDTISIYRNHFLTGFSLRDAPEFNEWIFTQSESLCSDLASALTLLVDSYLAQAQAELAIPHARRLISLDPLNESAHRQMMEVYLQAGQHTAALKQYQTCEQILRKELGIDPQPETLVLYKKIRKHEIKPVNTTPHVQVKASNHNLPLHLSTFIGREKEREEIRSLLTRNRIVTLVGAGGIGKTRLALQAGEKLLFEYPDGVWFISLDTLTDPALIPQTVASIFDIKNIAEHNIIERLINVLHDQTILLIFDNCEHLLNAAMVLIETLLKNCPKTKVLATSREILGIDGEAVYQVPSLSLPQVSLQTTSSVAKTPPRAEVIKGLDKFESIQLFSERAALALHKFSLTQENIESVTGICQMVDGIPLAIELASARVDILTPKEILEQLQKSFALLTHRGHAPVARHQSMRASMDWSWGLLTEQEQTLLQRLSVFSGGWTLEAAQSVCVDEALHAETILELMTSLVKKSLIIATQVDGHVTRYRLHEIIRQYANEKLIDEKRIRNQHLTYYLKLPGETDIPLKGLKSGEWLDRLELERSNLFTALDWASKTDLEAGLILSYSLSGYWRIFDLHNGVHWLSRFIDQTEAEEFPSARANALYARATLHIPLAQYEQAFSDAEKGLKIFEAIKNQRGEVDCLILLANASRKMYGYLSKKEYAQRALEISRALGDSWRQAMSLRMLGWECNDQRRRSYWEKSISLLRKDNHIDHLFYILNELADYEYTEGNYELAQEKFMEVIRLGQQTELKVGFVNVTYASAKMALLQGDYDRARKYLKETTNQMERIGDRQNTNWLFIKAGYVAVLQGELQEARSIFIRGAQNFHECHNELGIAFTLEGLANLCTRIGKYEQAARLIGWADAARKRFNDTRPQGEQADVDRIISACLIKIGEESFSDAYDEGQKMTMDEAVNLALEES